MLRGYELSIVIMAVEPTCPFLPGIRVERLLAKYILMAVEPICPFLPGIHVERVRAKYIIMAVEPTCPFLPGIRVERISRGGPPGSGQRPRYSNRPRGD